MKQKISAYAELIRFDKPIGTFLLFYPLALSYLFLEPYFAQLDILLKLFCGAFLMRSAGCIINDLCDRKFDRQVSRTSERPLASGAVTILEAIFILSFLLLVALAILITLGSKALNLGLLLIIPIIFYPLSKRFFPYPQLILGLTFNAGVFIASYALFGELVDFIWLIYAASIFWTIGYDTVYAHQDKQDDLKLGLNSTALNFGKYNKQIIYLCYLLFLSLLLIVGVQQGLGLLYMILLQLLGIIIFRDIKYIDLADPIHCQAFFLRNNYYGLAICLIIVVS